MPVFTEVLPRRRSRPGWPGLRLLICALALLGAAPHAFAISRIVLEVGEIQLPGTQGGGITATVDLGTRGAPKAHIRAARMDLPAPIGTLRDIQLTCGTVVVHEPTFACRDARLAAQGGPTKTISMESALEYNSAHGVTSFEGSGFGVAGGVLQFASRIDEGGWSVQGSGTGFDLQQVRALATPWFKVPAQFTFDGHVDVEGGAVSRNDDFALNGEVRTGDLNFTNQEGTIVAQKVATGVRVAAERAPGGGYDVEARLDGTGGQALAGPVLLDLGANQLRLDSRGRWAGNTLRLDEIALVQKNLSEVHGQANVELGKTPRVTQAHLDLTNVLFPAAYTSFMQIALAATDFGQLKTTGIAHGNVDIVNNAVTKAQLQLSHVGLQDTTGTFSMYDVNAGLNWIADEQGSVEPSYLQWERASAYGLDGGGARLDFVARAFGFELTKPTRLPLFDGGVVVNKLATKRLGATDAELLFDAKIEPISMPLLCRAFGWPEMSGQLSGTIPGLTYKNHVLSVDGDIAASVFDGTIVGRGFRLRDPLGPWPRLFADVTARRLDLSLVTRTFAIGSITGRLDVDIDDLELFNWSPVAFDAKLYSTPDDRTKKLISQKAVTSISNVGGGGGGVAAALQSGLLRFFDQFRYSQLGITCKLENEVCLMGGIEPAGMGYYMVKGRGLPRIDIIGNQGRVAWPQLVKQLANSIHADVVVRGSRPR
jgi:hypothetical protein